MIQLKSGVNSGAPEEFAVPVGCTFDTCRCVIVNRHEHLLIWNLICKSRWQDGNFCFSWCCHLTFRSMLQHASGMEPYIYIQLQFALNQFGSFIASYFNFVLWWPTRINDQMLNFR